MPYSVMHDFPVSEFHDRVRRTREAMAADGLDLLLAWSDSYRMSNVRWLSNYRAFDGVFPYPAMVALPLKGEPILFAEGSLVSTAVGWTWMSDVRGIRQELGNVLTEYAASGDVKRIGIAGYKYLAAEFLDTIRGAVPDTIEVGRTRILDYLKSIKSEIEIRNMKVAGRLADIGIEAVRLNAYEGVTERELVRAAYTSMFANGADTASFDIMVQTGENSANYFLARPTDRKLQRGDTILIDMGCRYNGYSSDMARGVAFGEVSADAQRMLDTCLEAWESGMKALRPGMTGAEADVAANEVLSAAGYTHDSGEGRGCAHGTGMDPEEEVPVIGPGSEWVLTVNQSFAFEITLLIPGVGGTRIEDTVILRSDGPESLTNYRYTNAWDWVARPNTFPAIAGGEERR
jgi:Xaa-Pro aminopeptidase